MAKPKQNNPVHDPAVGGIEVGSGVEPSGVEYSLQLTFMDEPHNCFLTLGGATFSSKAERNRAFASIPEGRESSPFIVDVLDDDDIVGDKLIDRPTVSLLLSKTADVLVLEARQREKDEAAARLMATGEPTDVARATAPDCSTKNS